MCLAFAGGAVGAVAGDLETLRGAGEVEVGGGGQDVDGALFEPPVSDVGGGVVCAVWPGQRGESGVEAVLVLLDAFFLTMNT